MVCRVQTTIEHHMSVDSDGFSRTPRIPTTAVLCKFDKQLPSPPTVSAARYPCIYPGHHLQKHQDDVGSTRETQQERRPGGNLEALLVAPNVPHQPSSRQKNESGYVKYSPIYEPAHFAKKTTTAVHHRGQGMRARSVEPPSSPPIQPKKSSWVSWIVG